MAGFEFSRTGFVGVGLDFVERRTGLADKLAALVLHFSQVHGKSSF
jgi:hypothetical protein